MFLEIKQIKKSFGMGDSRIEVLKGLIWRLRGESFVFFLDLLVLESLRC